MPDEGVGRRDSDVPRVRANRHWEEVGATAEGRVIVTHKRPDSIERGAWPTTR